MYKLFLKDVRELAKVCAHSTAEHLYVLFINELGGTDVIRSTVMIGMRLSSESRSTVFEGRLIRPKHA